MATEAVEAYEALVTGDSFKAYDAVTEYEELATIPIIFEAVTYDAVWAVVINAEELTHDAL